MNCQLSWISLTEWSLILELLLVPVSLHCFHIDNSLYTSNLELRLQLTSYLNNFLILLYLLWHRNLNTARDFLDRLVFTTLNCRADETLPWYLDNCSAGRITIKNSCACCCVLSANCGNSTLTTCLACTGCIVFPSVLCTNFVISCL